MKKLLCFTLSIVFLFSFAACKKDDNSSNSGAVDVEYYAKLGSMPESKYSLGEDVEVIKNELEEAYNTVEEAVFNVVEGEETVQIDSGSFQYYYYKDKVENGISYLVSFKEAFGFETGTVSVEITDALKDYKYTEEKFNENNSFFVLGINEGKVIKYKFSKNTVSFLFVNDALYATAIYKTVDWE